MSRLPERRFTKPLARAVVEQRRKLVEDPRDRLQIARAIEALTLEPEEFIDDLQVYLGLRSVFYRLQQPSTRSVRNSIIEQLWNVALRIEDGNLTDAERALKAAQERLSKAIEEGASDEEIQRLMQELRQALAQFLDQLRKQAEGQQQPMPQGTSRNQMMTPQDLDQMLKKISYYSELNRRIGAPTHSALNIWVRSVWSFFKSYVLKRGFLEGWRGIVIAHGDAMGTFFKHIKRYADKAVETEQRELPK